jgi:hypothetical protein
VEERSENTGVRAELERRQKDHTNKTRCVRVALHEPQYGSELVWVTSKRLNVRLKLQHVVWQLVRRFGHRCEVFDSMIFLNNSRDGFPLFHSIPTMVGGEGGIIAGKNK